MLYYALIVLRISRQSIKARASYSDFKKCCRKNKKNMKKIRRTLKAHILGRAWWIQFKFGIAGAPPQRNSHGKFCAFLFRECVELQMHENRIFFTPVKYTLVCRTPQVSWATRHTTLCLDHDNGYDHHTTDSVAHQ